MAVLGRHGSVFDFETIVRHRIAPGIDWNASGTLNLPYFARNGQNPENPEILHICSIGPLGPWPVSDADQACMRLLDFKAAPKAKVGPEPEPKPGPVDQCSPGLWSRIVIPDCGSGYRNQGRCTQCTECTQCTHTVQAR